jgi:histone H3/H4
LDFKIIELLSFRIRGSTLAVIAKRLGTSEEKLFPILDSMIENGKLVKKGKYYRLRKVSRVINAEMPIAPCHRILLKYSELRVSPEAVKKFKSIFERVGKSMASEAGKSAKKREGKTITVGDVEVAASKLGYM